MAAVYVSGFDRDTDEKVMKDHFSAVGKVTDLYFQSKGSAVVTYEAAASADRAVAEINGTTMQGQERYVAVKLNGPKPAKGSGKGGNTGGAAVFANGFDFGTDEVAVKKHFGKVGKIKELYFQSNGSAVVTYDDAATAARAVAEINGTTMKGQERYVSVKLDDPDRESKGGKKGGGKKGDGKKGGGKNGSDKSSGASVYASGFDFETDEGIVWKHFGTVGKISDVYFQSSGSAVITYEQGHAANRAAAELDGTTMKGQTRYVSVKLDDPDRKKGGKSKGSPKGGKSAGKGKGKGSGGSGNAVYASGFDYDTDDAAARKHFGKVGAIKDLYFQSKGAAVITYEEVEAANRAVAELDGSTMKGQERYVAVHLDARSSKGGKGKGKSY